MSLSRSMARWLAHTVFQTDRVRAKMLRKYCSDIRDCRVLEIGSGRRVNGELIYSVAEFFQKNNNQVTMSDIDPEFSHEIVDITRSVPGGYDVIVCLNVLEHVYDYRSGVSNMHAALPEAGQLLVYVPMFYPLHDEPHDYFRFSEHALRNVLAMFSSVEVMHFGVRQFPTGYFAKAIK